MALSHLKNGGKLPGERKLVVNDSGTLSQYTPYSSGGAGGGGVEVRMDFKTLPEIHGIVGVWQFPIPKYSLAVGGWAGNIVNVLLGCHYDSGVSCFSEIPSTTAIDNISVFVAAMGR